MKHQDIKIKEKTSNAPRGRPILPKKELTVIVKVIVPESQRQEILKIAEQMRADKP